MSRVPYLHIGNNFSVSVCDIVGIFDMDRTTVGGVTRKFLKTAEKNGICMTSASQLPKSFIIAGKQGRERVYISQLSPLTLRRRIISQEPDGGLL